MPIQMDTFSKHIRNLFPFSTIVGVGIALFARLLFNYCEMAESLKVILSIGNFTKLLSEKEKCCRFCPELRCQEYSRCFDACFSLRGYFSEKSCILRDADLTLAEIMRLHERVRIAGVDLLTANTAGMAFCTTSKQGREFQGLKTFMRCTRRSRLT
jgi:hypothetical protein